METITVRENLNIHLFLLAHKIFGILLLHEVRSSEFRCILSAQYCKNKKQDKFAHLCVIFRFYSFDNRTETGEKRRNSYRSLHLFGHSMLFSYGVFIYSATKSIFGAICRSSCSQISKTNPSDDFRSYHWSKIIFESTVLLCCSDRCGCRVDHVRR